MRVVALVLVAAALGCSRDLDLPSSDAVSIRPAFVTAAPREGKTFAAAGGAGGYRFAFAEGSPLSGGDATIDPVTGAYKAGSLGSALDVVQVTDASGRTALATVSVGARLAITPSLVGTAPGNAVQFTASGGKAPYAFALTTDASGASVHATTGRYVAGAVSGDVRDVVTVTDSTYDPDASAEAQVLVGTKLKLYRPDTRTVAPGEQIQFIAFGGQPRYTYSLAARGSGTSATIDATSGLYTAGDRAGDDALTEVTDVVTVTDSANPSPQSDSLTVRVGPRLRFTTVPAEAHSGDALRLVATGGKTPYAYGFADRLPPGQDPNRESGGNGGNRSGGTVDPATGEYRPGPSLGAIDFFQVRDATGGAAVVAEGPVVRAATIPVVAEVQSCLGGDFDGDWTDDVAFLVNVDSSEERPSMVITAERLASGVPLVQPLYPTSRRLWYAWSADYAGLGRDQLVFAGAEHADPLVTWRSSDVWRGVPDFAGVLGFEQVSGGTSTASHGIRAGAMRWDEAAKTWRLWTDGSWPAPGGSRSLMRFDWAQGGAPPSAPTYSFIPNGGYGNMLAMVAGDFNGDGFADLAWIDDTGGEIATGVNARLRVALAVDVASFNPPTAGWKDPAWTFDGGWRFRGEHHLAVVSPQPGSPAPRKDVLVVRLLDPAGRPKLFVMRDPSLAASWQNPFDPYPETSPAGASGFVPYVPSAGASTALAAWNGLDGVVRGFSVTNLGAGETPSFGLATDLATLPFTVDVACFVDVNGDRSPDLVAAGDWAHSAEVVLANGTSSTPLSVAGGGDFSPRLNLRGIGYPIASADVDGDGFGDLLMAENQAVRMLWGGGGQLAWGEEVAYSAPTLLAAADFTGSGRPAALYRTRSSDFEIVAYDAASATFSSPVSVPAFQAASGAPGVSDVMYNVTPADLGTAAPGVDLIGYGRDDVRDAVTVHPLLLQADGAGAPRLVHVAAAEIPSDGAGRVPVTCGVLPVGAGQPEIGLLCGHRVSDDMTAVYAWRGTIANRDAAPGSPSPPSLPSWTQLTPAAAAPPVVAWPAPGTFSADMHGVQAAGNVQAGWPGTVAAGTAVFVMNVDRLYVVEVGSDWTPRAYAVTPTLTGLVPDWATLGRLDTTSWFHLAVSGRNGETYTIRRDATGYSWRQRLTGGGLPFVMTPLAAGSPGDLITFRPGASMTGGDGVAIVLRNDGSGMVR